MTQVQTKAKPAIPSKDKLPRVILAIRHFYPDGGGAEVLARRLAVRLVQRGLSLTVLTGRYGGRPRTGSIDGVVVHRHFIGLYLPVLHEVCYLTSLARELVARRHDYDIVHVFQTQLSAYIAAVICKRLGKNLVVTSHGAGATGDMAVWSSVPAGMRLLRYVCVNVDGATGVSKDVMAELHEAGFDPKRTWYVPNGVAIPSSHRSDQSALRKIFGLRSKSFIAVFVGRVTAKKVPEFLLDAWTAVLQKYPSSQLLLVGEGEQRAMLEARTRQADLAGSVIFTGRVENVEDCLRAADIFVLPSITEGMSIALLEAMAVGLPVVASRVSGTVDVIKHGANGLLFEPGSRTGLTDCIVSLIESSNRRAELGRLARTTVAKHFSIDATVDRYVALYKSVLYGNCCKG
jgi:glycosyltransferase involved in cell wall biosynthesis